MPGLIQTRCRDPSGSENTSCAEGEGGERQTFTEEEAAKNGRELTSVGSEYFEHAPPAFASLQSSLHASARASEMVAYHEIVRRCLATMAVCAAPYEHSRLGSQ